MPSALVVLFILTNIWQDFTMIKALLRAELRGYRQTNIPTFRDPHLSSHFLLLSLSPTQHRRQTCVVDGDVLGPHTGAHL